MKKFIVSLFIISLLTVTQNTVAQWVQMSNGIAYVDKVFPFGILENNIFTGVKNHGIY